MARVHEATQVFIDVSTPDGERSGLRQNSAAICTNRFTIEKRLVLFRIGALSDDLMSRIEDYLKSTFEIP